MGNVIEKHCANCGRVFYTRIKDKIFCDLRCEICFKEGTKVLPDIVEDTTEEKPSKYCKYCGKKFYPRNRNDLYVFKDRLYCSRSCVQKSRHKNQKINKFPVRLLSLQIGMVNR